MTLGTFTFRGPYLGVFRSKHNAVIVRTMLRNFAVMWQHSDGVDNMHFEEVDAGDYRIYAGAVERSRQYGYVAAVVVVRVRGRLPKQETYRNESLASGYPWASAREALTCAIKAGKDFAFGRVAVSA